jgi:DNA polymerase-3 subunit alpha
MPAVAITDTNNMFGALEFAETLPKSGVQPIIGCQFTVTDAGAVVLLAQSEAGYKNLLKLTSHLHLSGQEALSVQTFAQYSAGLICLTGGAGGALGRLIQDGKTSDAEDLLDELAQIYPERLYVELQRHGVDGNLRTAVEAQTEPILLDLAYARGLPVVATNEVFFDDKAMYEAHDALLCIAEGSYVSQDNRRRLNSTYHFRSADEMIELFSDLPEAIENTVQIAKRCAYRPHTHPPILPKFAEDEVEELRRQAHEGLTKRLQMTSPVTTEQEYRERLDFELDVIENMGFPGYFLIVADFIKWAKDNGIPVGPGRGSGAGSLVAYSLTITNLDPLRYGLLFERFLNPERVSMPDFDIDFCQERRDEVITYVQNRYGKDRVAQIITFGKLQARAALRDIGRVLQMPYGQVDRLCRLVPNTPGSTATLKEIIRDETQLQDAARAEPVVKKLLDIAMQVEGLYRNASTHAAGVVIGDRPLDELVPLYQDPRSEMPATQFNMKWVEPAGLVKYDFLGLKTLTVIQNAVELLKHRGIDIDPDTFPLDDAATYELYSRADTVGVFQVESSGMRDALKGLKPTCIEDIIALVSLYRPGPMDNIPRYNAIKHGLEQPDYLHPKIEHILKETHGIIIYQEQVMQIAQVLSGYSLGQADMLRRAMGKKIASEMEAQRAIFVEGAVARDVPQKKAMEIFDLLAKFASYGFNKSHAAAYAVVSYQTGYLKANYPVEFMAATMNFDLHNTDKLSVYKQELDRMKIALVPPCVNRSDPLFSVKDGQVVYALGALKNVGRDAMQLIANARRSGGVFKDLFDFAIRVDLKMIGKRALENLTKAGAFDQLNQNRAFIFENLAALVAYSAHSHEESSSAQVSLFGGQTETLEPPRLKDVMLDWTPAEKLSFEHEAIGFYLSGHPLDIYLSDLQDHKIMTFTQLTEALQSTDTLSTRLAGIVVARQDRKSQKGTRYAFLQLSDPTGMFEAVVFSDTLTAHRDTLTAGNKVVIGVEAEQTSDQIKMRVQSVQTVENVVGGGANTARNLTVYVQHEVALSSLKSRLDALPKTGVHGKVSLQIRLQELGCTAIIDLEDQYSTSTEAARALQDIYGIEAVKVG